MPFWTDLTKYRHVVAMLLCALTFLAVLYAFPTRAVTLINGLEGHFISNKMDLIQDPSAPLGAERKICLELNDFPLHYRHFFGLRAQHLQALIRLPDFEGKHYYMGTFSQSLSGDRGGMVFVAELYEENRGRVIWLDELNITHPSGGYNHPGDLHRLGDMVVIAGQNWSECSIELTFVCLIHTGFFISTSRPELQNVLFYDVSNPRQARYLGQLNRCWDGPTARQYGSDGEEIDKVSVTHAKGDYYLSFGRGDKGLICRSKYFAPNARWELLGRGANAGYSPAYFRHEGRDVVGNAVFRGDSLRFNQWRFLSGGSNQIGRSFQNIDFETVISLSTPPTQFKKNAFTVSTMKSGKYCVIATDVLSDGELVFKERCQR